MVCQNAPQLTGNTPITDIFHPVQVRFLETVWNEVNFLFYHKETKEVYVGLEAPEDSENWEQDSDVLDTWFSSNTPITDIFHPVQVRFLETVWNEVNFLFF
jgi:valyl-tRNA synthetase